MTWAKKAQNGVLFVSEELATFFQEEKKFNTTWEGDSAGMVRLLALLNKLDLDQVQRTGERARQGLRHWRATTGKSSRTFAVRASCWHSTSSAPTGGTRYASARSGAASFCCQPGNASCVSILVMTPNHPPSTRRWRFFVCRSRISWRAGRAGTDHAVEIRIGTLAIPLDTLEVVDLTQGAFETHKLLVLAVEQERYGAAGKYPPDALRAGRRPLLQFPLETLETTASNVRAIGIALRDRVSSRFVAYALGSALEDHDEEGVQADPHFGENNTFYLQAMATSPTVQNDVELENFMLDLLRTRAIQAGFEFSRP